MKLRRQHLAFGLVITSLLPVLWQCAGSQDQEDEEYLQDEGDAEDAEQSADAEEEEATEQTVDNSAPSEEETAEAPAEEGGGGNDFSAMLAEMQKQAGGKVPSQAQAKPAKANKPAAAATATDAPSDPSGPEAMWVFVEKAWIYTAPATDSTKVAQVDYGTKLEVTAVADGWLQLGANKFLRAQDMTDRKAKFGKKVLNQTVIQGGGKGGHRVKSEQLAVRSAPNLTAKVVGFRNQNETVKVLSDSNGWSQIGPGQYVRSKYLYTGNEAPIGTGDQVYVVKTDGLYIRSKPDMNASSVGVLLKGNKVRVSDTNDGWSQIGPNRYIRTKHLTPVAPLAH